MGAPIDAIHLSIFSGDIPQNKGKVSYDQWAYRVKGVRGLYSESVPKEGKIRSLKGFAVDNMQYLDPHSTVDEVLEKLNSVYGNVAPFDVLMQGFYHLQQDKNERMAAFTTWLEGTLSDIMNKHPCCVTGHEAKGHLHNRLFHRLHKPLRDSLWYLFNNPMLNYSQLMVAA